MSNIKVLIVEDHLMVRMGLSLVLEKMGDIDLIGEAENGIEGVNKAKSLLPDVVLMDIGLPEIDGIEATKRIKETNPEIKILMFTSYVWMLSIISLTSSMIPSNRYWFAEFVPRLIHTTSTPE